MGGVIGTAASGLGSVIGNVVAAPFKSILKGSCQEVCSGTWDLVCFIEHLCVSSLIKLVMVLGLCYSALLFVYLLFKLGIIQCIVTTLCKMCWTVFAAYWYALAHILRFFWRKLASVKRVNRRRDRDYRSNHYNRRRDIESGCGFSSDVTDDLESVSKKRRFVRRREQSKFSRRASRMTGGSIRDESGHRRSKPGSVSVRRVMRERSRRVRIERTHHHSRGRDAMKVKRRKLLH